MFVDFIPGVYCQFLCVCVCFNLLLLKRHESVRECGSFVFLQAVQVYTHSFVPSFKAQNDQSIQFNSIQDMDNASLSINQSAVN